MRIYLNPLYVLLISVFLIAGCRKEHKKASAQPSPVPKMEFLGEQKINKEDFNSRTATIQGIQPNTLWGLLATLVVNVYKVTYSTKDLDGNPIEASGLMVVPKTSNAVSLISFQNGTVFDPRQAASYYHPESPLQQWLPLAAAMGNVVIVPDYLGYGTSGNIPHPYQHASSLANSVKDMIIAARTIMEARGINWNHRLFLAGYSEGGYATMAAHRLLEGQFPIEFPVTAASCGAGAYDLTATAKYFLSRNEVRDSFYIRSHSWVLLTYNKIYGFNRPLNTLFNPPYDSELANRPIPVARLSTNPTDLITPAFREGVLNGTDQQVLHALAQNDVYDWYPKAPVYLLHAALDTYVPIFNSEKAYASFTEKGITVKYEVIPNKGHPDAIPDFALRTLSYFGTFK